MNAGNLKEQIKKMVLNADDSAQIYLFGSHARNTAAKESDWDVLILLNKNNVTLQDEQSFRHILYNLELETGEVISTFVYSKKDWNSKYAATPLYQAIQQEGIRL